MFKLPGLLAPFGVIALLVRLASAVRPQVLAAEQQQPFDVAQAVFVPETGKRAGPDLLQALRSAIAPLYLSVSHTRGSFTPLARSSPRFSWEQSCASRRRRALDVLRYVLSSLQRARRPGCSNSRTGRGDVRGCCLWRVRPRQVHVLEWAGGSPRPSAASGRGGSGLRLRSATGQRSWDDLATGVRLSKCSAQGGVDAADDGPGRARLTAALGSV